MVFPVVKLGYLAFKQVSKPLANFMKARAKSSPFFRRYICAYPAQIYHRFETNIRMRLLGLHADSVKPLTEEMAVVLGAEMLGEIVIFTVAGVVLYLESMRSAAKEQAIDDALTERITQLEAKLQDLGLEIAHQDTKVRELTRIVYSQQENTVSGKLAKVLGSHDGCEKDNTQTVDVVVNHDEEILKLEDVNYRRSVDQSYELYSQAFMLIAACLLVYLKVSER